MNLLKRTLILTMTLMLLLPVGVTAEESNIKVHGHWTLKIYNPDGSLDQLVEFENGLISSGTHFLIGMLAKRASVGSWQIRLKSTSGSVDDPCTSQTNQARQCIIQESGASDSHEFNTLTFATDTPVDPTKLILSGSAVVGAMVNGPQGIDNVFTNILSCGPTEKPNCVSTGTNFGFTIKVLPTMVLVSPGQTIQVTVEISFS